MTAPPLAIQDEWRRKYIHPLSGECVPSVTTVLQMLPKDGLSSWMAKKAAEFAVERWEELGTLTPGERLESIRTASEEVSRPAAEKGDLVHDIIDSWMSGRPRDDDPGQVNSYMNSFIRFLTDTRPRFIENEVCLFSRAYDYCGTADWIAELDGKIVLGDTKSGKAIYPEAALQVSALAHADFILRDNGDEEKIPPISDLMVLNVRPRSWKLARVKNSEACFQVFLGARRIYDWINGLSDEVLEPL